ncbi:MAG: hypothetical protein RL660_1337 [Bacteroidota bacterium]|jgi:hypothetical protein
MMRILLALLLMLCNATLFAQVDASSTVPADDLQMQKKKRKAVKNPKLVYQPRSWYIMASTGAPNNLRSQWRDFEDLATFKSRQSLPYTLKLERTFDKGWGVVIGASRVGGEYNWIKSVPDSTGQALLYNQGFKFGNTSVYAGATRYLYYNEKFATYGSAMFGINNNTYVLSNEGGSRVQMLEPKPLPALFYNIVLGGKYNFTKRFGLYAEVGYGRLQFINIGAQLRLNAVKVLDKRGRITKE